jgi:RimJ/RimL family protein N-acetyltransferase
MCEGAHVHVVAGTDELITKRLRLRPWTGDDVDAALAIFGQQEVARWLTPAMPRVADRDEMRQLLARCCAAAATESGSGCGSGGAKAERL